MENLAMKQDELEHEKLKPSLIHKANAEILQSTYEARTSGAKVLSADHYKKWQTKLKLKVLIFKSYITKIREMNY
jgi:hypothetical protein